MMNWPMAQGFPYQPNTEIQRDGGLWRINYKFHDSIVKKTTLNHNEVR